jgi:hypothetical protein
VHAQGVRQIERSAIRNRRRLDRLLSEISEKGAVILRDSRLLRRLCQPPARRWAAGTAAPTTSNWMAFAVDRPFRLGHSDAEMHLNVEDAENSLGIALLKKEGQKGTCTRRGSNPQPTAPEAVALSN